jgi:hypothetical protein
MSACSGSCIHLIPEDVRKLADEQFQLLKIPKLVQSNSYLLFLDGDVALATVWTPPASARAGETWQHLDSISRCCTRPPPPDSRHASQHSPHFTAGRDRQRRSTADRESSATGLARRSDRPSSEGRTRALGRLALRELDRAHPVTRLCGASHHRDGRQKPGATPGPAGLCAGLAPLQKSPKPPRRRRLDRSRRCPRPIRGRRQSIVQGRHVERGGIFGSVCPAVGNDSRAVERYRPSVTGASSGLTLNTHRIGQDRRNGD